MLDMEHSEEGLEGVDLGSADGETHHAVEDTPKRAVDEHEDSGITARGAEEAPDDSSVVDLDDTLPLQAAIDEDKRDVEEGQVSKEQLPPKSSTPPLSNSPLKDLYMAAFSDVAASSSTTHVAGPSSHAVPPTNGIAMDLTPVARKPSYKSSQSHTASLSSPSRQSSRDSMDSLSPVSLDEVPLDGDGFSSFGGSLDPTSSKPAVASPPATSKSSIFGSLGFFGSTSPGAASANLPRAPDYSRSSSSSSASPASEPSLGEKVRQTSQSWRAGITNYLSAPPKSPVLTIGELTPVIEVYTPRSLQRPQMDRNVSSSTAFLLNQVTASSGSRRRSSEGINGLKEGFVQKRMRAEMENAARDTRQSGQAREDRLMEAAEFGEGDGDDEEGEVGAAAPPREDGIVEGIDWQFWGAVMGDYEDVARTRAQDLSRAIQQGIPAVIRGTMWQLMSSSKSSVLEQKYSTLLKVRSPHEKNIQKDLARTLSHSYFKEAGGVGQENLFNVVKAYSLFDHEVGYTQGIAFCVAPLLLLMPEEEAFCVLVRLMESYDLRSHFLPEMPGLQLRLYQFDRLLEEILPVLHLHFVRTGIKSSMYASQWFMTMFSYRFPLSLVFRIYDIVFAEGIEAIFRFSLALLITNEQHLLGLDFEGILKFLQTNLFDKYRLPQTETPEVQSTAEVDENQWDANAFVSDAYTARITPFMLDSYAGEYQERVRIQNAHAIEMDSLRNANRNLSAQVKSLESALASMNNEHVELVRQLVNSRIEKEEVENQLIETKLKLAEISHAHDFESSSTHRLSSVSSLQR